MKKRPRRLEVFYKDPCVSPPVIAREKGTVDRKTLVGAALARCICEDVVGDEWHLTYERGKYGRSVQAEFEKVLVKIQRLYRGFGKEIVVKINGIMMCDSRGFDCSVEFPSMDLFDDSYFKTRRERANELNRLFREWAVDDSRMRIGVNIPQLGIVSDVIMRGDSGVQALELMRYRSGVRGSWSLARLRSYGALASILEVARFGLNDGGGIVLGHFGNPRVKKLAEEISGALRKVTDTSYPVTEAPFHCWIAMINLSAHRLQIRKMLSKSWKRLPCTIESIKSFVSSSYRKR